MSKLTAATQVFVRFAAVALSAWAVSGAVALADGSSEYEILSGDPLQSIYGEHDDDDHGHDHGGDGVSPGSFESIELGSNNNAIVIQKGSAGNRLEVVQSGEGNYLFSHQTALSDDNRAEISQSGGHNASILIQYGGDNRYELEQSGENNLSQATQFGNDNRFEHTQNGDNLGIAVTQYGDSTIKITQTGY